jgi:hypothetical protein
LIREPGIEKRDPICVWVCWFEILAMLVAEKINLVPNLGYSQQPLVEAPIGDKLKIESKLS